MYQLFETIFINDGILQNVEYHHVRCNQARYKLWGISNEINLDEVIHVPVDMQKGAFRCRVTYSEKVNHIEFSPFVPRIIKSMKLVYDDQIQYEYKSTDRIHLERLFEQREHCDEVIIVKNGFITDTSVGNLVLFDGHQWWTPSTPLLKGTQRAKLLDKGIIKERIIRVNDVFSFQKIGMINAMYNLENMSVISINACMT